MKEKIKNIKQKIIEQNLRTILAFVVLVIAVGAIGVVVFSRLDKTEVVKADGEATTTPYSLVDDASIVAVVGADATTMGSVEMNNSWPGEIVSSEISQIQPQREGVITDWKVRIGENVLAGEVLGKISPAPATPELIKMLAEQAQMASRSKAEAVIADEFAAKERERLEALKSALDGNVSSSADLSFKALDSMRKKLESKKTIVRSFIERTLSSHVGTVTNFIDWRYFRFGGLNTRFGIYNPSIQNDYQISIMKLADKLKNSTDLPVEDAEKYFSLVVKLANNSGNLPDYPEIEEFKMTAAADQKEFLDMLSDYRMAQAEVADKETEYKIMVNEGGSMIEKDRSMAHAEADAAEAAYGTVAKAINSGTYIISPRSGTVSAIYKKVGELVDPTMPIAVVVGYGKDNLIVRLRIPNNIKKPIKGELLSVVRPGFLRDIYKAKIIGIGTALDETGSYMADAILIDHVDWPSGASVRAIPSQDSNTPAVKLSSVWWTEEGIPNVWGVSAVGRLFAKKITIGRTIGVSVEIYGGLKDGDRYLISPTPDLKENMLLEDIVPKDGAGGSPAKSSEKKPMGGMEM